MNSSIHSSQESGVFKIASLLGKASGFAIAVLATPPVYDFTVWLLAGYLSGEYGEDMASFLLLCLGLAEGIAIWCLAALAVTSAAVMVMASAVGSRL